MGGGKILNVLTGLILIATFCIIGVYAVIFVNPYLPINPLPPPTIIAALQLATPTENVGVALPPTWTATPELSTSTPTPTHTITPTSTTSPTSSPWPTGGTEPSGEATLTPSPSAPAFILQDGSPILTQNFANDQGCEWMGVAGQVFDLDGQPIMDLTIHIEGRLAGEPVDMDALTGDAPDYGEGGYEIVLGDHPVASTNSLRIHIADSSGMPLSDEIRLTTSDECEENLILVNWTQIH